MKDQISLKAARINSGLTQGELAQILDLNVATVSRWENAKHPKAIAVYSWAGALRLNPDIIRT